MYLLSRKRYITLAPLKIHGLE